MDRNAQASTRVARARAWLSSRMQMLTALPLRARLLLSFALIVALMLAFGAFALMEMAGLNRDTRDIAEGWLPRSQLAAAMKIEAVGVRVAQFQFIAVGEAVESEDGYVGVVDKAAQAEADIARHLQRLDEFKQRYAALPADEAQQVQFAAFVEAWSNYQASSELFLGMAKDETLRLADAAGRGEFSLRGDAAQFQFAFRDIIDGLNRLMGTAEQGLQAVGTVLAGLAAGDLTQRMHGQFHGRFAELQGHAEHSLQQLGDIVQRIQQSAELIESASGEIAAGNQELSARTEAQASNLEETASSIEELAGVVGQNAANAREAKQLAANAGDVARRGGAVVEQVVGTMGAIADPSKRIADIMAEIANGSAEQSAGIAQVNQAIAQIDGATQQNAALVEEAAAAARSLTEQAAELRQAAASFVLSRTD